MVSLNNTFFYRFVLIASFVASIIIIYYRFATNLQYEYFIIPISFFALLFTLNKTVRMSIGKLPGLTTLLIVLFARYCILPLFIYKTEELSIYAHDYSYIGIAIWLMLFEMICIMLAVNIFYKPINSNSFNTISSHKKLKARPSLLVFSIVMMILILITNRDLIGGFSLITNGYIEDTGVLTEKSSLPKMLWTIFSTFVYVYSIYYIANKHNFKVKNKTIFISILLTLLFILITYISQERISRWYTLVCAISAIYFLRKMFPEQRKKITLYILIPVITLMVSATLFKNFAESKLTGRSEDELLITNLDSYLAGPVSVNNAISLEKNRNVGISNFLIDITNNMPIVNHYVDKDNASVYQYNVYLGRVFGKDSRGDQIIPLIGQSYTYWGFIFAPILSIIYVWIISFFDQKYLRSSNYFCYLLAFTSCWCALAVILNMTLNLSWVYIRIIPIYVLFILMKKI